MAVKRVIPLPQISGSNAGTTWTVTVPVGPRRYHMISLEYTSGAAGGATQTQMETDITEIRVNLNSTVQRRMSAKQMNVLNAEKGKSVTAGSSGVPGYLSILFSEPQRKGVQAREATAWGMNGVGSFTIEVDIASGATSPKLAAWAVIDDIPAAPASIVKVKRDIITVAATGNINYKADTLKGDAYEGITFIENTAGDISALLATWDNLTLYQDNANFAKELLNQSDYSRQSGYRYVPLNFNSIGDFVPSIKKNPDGSLQKVAEFLFTLTMANAANVTAMREVIGQPD